MPKYMIDLRCPACSKTVQGREEVIHSSKLPKITSCPHCKTNFKLVKDDKDDDYYYFDNEVIHWTKA